MKSWKILTSVALTIALALSAAGLSAAQMMYTCSGHVYDSDTDDPIGGAHVVAQNQMTSQTYDDYADGSGYFSIDLPEGNYHVEITASDYNDFETDRYIDSSESGDVYLDPYDSGNGDGSGDGEGFDPASFLEGYMWVAYLLVTLAIVLFVCIVVTSIATTATFVRLGKVRKEMKEMNEKLDEMEKRQAQPPQQQWQQQQAYQQPAYQQPPQQMPPQQSYQQPPQQ